MTVNEAVNRYIKAKSTVLSPSTISGYIRYKDLYFQSLNDIDISQLSTEILQIAVNKETSLSPKTLRNAYSLVLASIKMFDKTAEYKISLPQKIKKSIYIPEKKEIMKIFKLVKNTDLEIPFILASQCGLRPSEIAGLDLVDVGHGLIKITQARVIGLGGREYTKPPKTNSGYRTIPIPEQLEKLLIERSAKDGRVCCLSSVEITRKWVTFLRKNNLRHFKFYALRHYFASQALILGMPQKYIAELMGHSSLNMIEQVYQHTFPSIMEKYKKIICQNTENMMKGE